MKSPDVSETAKKIAKKAAGALGGTPLVRTYWDDDERRHIGLLSSNDRPDAAITAFSTVGLAEYPVFRGDKKMPFRLEFCGACASRFSEFDRIIATAAFSVINSNWYCEPGMIFPDLVSMYDAFATLKHLFFVPPFLWEELGEFHVNNLTVAWLLAMPISQAEREYAVLHGWDKLEDLFVKRQTDIFNLDRPSEI